MGSTTALDAALPIRLRTSTRDVLGIETVIVEIISEVANCKRLLGCYPGEHSILNDSVLLDQPQDGLESHLQYVAIPRHHLIEHRIHKETQE